MEYKKVKSVAKKVTPKGKSLEGLVLKTMKTVSDIVGSTLGPGGCPVLIERYEFGLPPILTKDGVTVFRSLGFDEASAHCIMEVARDAAVRTASEAGDGTSTATVLAESIVRKTSEFCKNNPRMSPQRVVRMLERTFNESIEPLINSLSIPCTMQTEEGKKLLHSVAKVSANGDTELADAVMECFDIVGDEGNVTISEISGSSKYEVEQIEGYPVSMGYEESCAKYYAKYINDPGTQRCVMEKPVFLVFHGRITEMQTIVNLLLEIGTKWGSGAYDHHNIVLVATGFSETVISQLALNFQEATTINVFPLLAPQSPTINGQLNFLQDVCAITGATLLDPMNRPPDFATLEDLGPGISMFEAFRFRSNIIGHAEGDLPSEDGNPLGTYEDRLLLHVDNLQTQLKDPESTLDKMLLQERVAKVTGGIAKLKVVGASNGELKEKRDRAEDAVCAVRGALKYGCLPGGGWTLLKIISTLKELNNPIVTDVLIPALIEPVIKMLSNVGINLDSELQGILNPILEGLVNGKMIVYDALEDKHVDAVEGGILDSTPAVLEALRNSISIAALLGTLGGAVVFLRDDEFERQEARDTSEFTRNANSTDADERI